MKTKLLIKGAMLVVSGTMVSSTTIAPIYAATTTPSTVTTPAASQTQQSNLRVPFNDDINYGYSLLNDVQKKAYKLIRDTFLSYSNVDNKYLRNKDNNVLLPVNFKDAGIKIELDDLYAAYKAALGDDPRSNFIKNNGTLSDLKQDYDTTQGKWYVSLGNLEIRYDKDGNEYQNKLEEIEQTVSEILKSVKTGMTQYQKVEAIRKAYEKTLEYSADFSKYLDPGTMWSALGKEHRAACGGYSWGFEYLLKKAGFETIVVAGYADKADQSSGHGWNNVKIDGKWYLIDSTWDWGPKGSSDAGVQKRAVYDSYKEFLKLPTLEVNPSPDWKEWDENAYNTSMEVLKDAERKVDVKLFDLKAAASNIENAQASKDNAKLQKAKTDYANALTSLKNELSNYSKLQNAGTDLSKNIQVNIDKLDNEIKQNELAFAPSSNGSNVTLAQNEVKQAEARETVAKNEASEAKTYANQKAAALTSAQEASKLATDKAQAAQKAADLVLSAGAEKTAAVKAANDAKLIATQKEAEVLKAQTASKIANDLSDSAEKAATAAHDAFVAIKLAADKAVTDKIAAQAPVVQTPQDQAPVVQTPQAQAPMVQTPQAQAPVVQTPQAQAPVVQTPQAQAPVVQTPQVQAPVVQTPQAQTPVVQTPQVQAPVVQTPQAQTPVVQTPQAQAPVAQTPQVQAPVVQTPQVKTPVANPTTNNVFKQLFINVNGKNVASDKVGHFVVNYPVAHANHLSVSAVTIVKSGSSLKISGLKADFGYKISSVKCSTDKNGVVTFNVTTSKVGYAVYVKYGKSNKKVVSGSFTYNKNLKRFSNKNHVSGTPKFVFKTSHGKKVLVVKGLKANKHYKITKVNVKYVKGVETAFVSVSKTR